jgi:hypothetical protein
MVGGCDRRILPKGRVWPWIVQMGYTRAGFYTYDLVDDAGYESSDHVLEHYPAFRGSRLGIQYELPSHCWLASSESYVSHAYTCHERCRETRRLPISGSP